MMKRINYIVNGIAAVATIFMFVQCSGKSDSKSASGNFEGTFTATDLKIAYVEIDSLLIQYNLWKDLSETMTKKEEDVRATLNQKGRELEQEAQEFQRKLENNAFASRERAEQEHDRILKKQQSIQELQNRLSNELLAETQKNDLILRDSINSFLKEYNKTRNYSFILSTSNANNILYADNTYNITKEVLEGLNVRYTRSTKK
ncbi:hypothetical protein EZS27_000025 [termite gut metagenome]|jgi:outer membrane protein|uniref:Chaperone protein Skp n=1 Tax=termite gut metagenome TaxID=433724 RepID=A0A5J4T4E0_9ZZZZ